jgi:hypothetical protein
VTKVAKKLPKDPTLEQQVELLKREVLIFQKDFERGTVGRIVSIRQTHNMYWVLLNHMFKKKDGKWSRKRMFHEDQLRLIDEKE